MVITKLATTKKQPVTDFFSYLLLVYGREKIGKTTLFSQIENAYFLTTEPGTKGLEIYESMIGSWEDFRAVVALLEKTPLPKFPFIVVDTVDVAYDMCLDWTCKELNIDYPGQDEDGREDYGKSWRRVKKEFMTTIHRILKTGRGLGFTSHATEMEIKTRSGEKYVRIFPSMSKQARAVIEPLVDFFFFADYVRMADGGVGRVIITKGDETVWAGTRTGVGEFPPILPLQKEGGVQVLIDGFMGQHPGVDPSTLRSVRSSSQAGQALIRKLASEKTAPPHQGAARKPLLMKKRS